MKNFITKSSRIMSGRNRYIEKTVRKKLKELNLSPEIPLSYFKKKNKRFYSTPCRTKNKETVFLKMLLVKEKGAAYSLRKEIEITKFLSNFYQKKKGLNIPLFIKGNCKKFPYWFLHQYLPGPLIGYFYDIHKQGLKKRIRKAVVDNLLALQSIAVEKYKSSLSKISLNKRGFTDYLKMIKEREKILNKEKDIDFKSIYNFMENQKKYFKSESFVLAHGDFTLANFFVNQNKVYITDWEYVHLDNLAYDISHLWIQTWQYPKWRKKLILYFLSKLPKYKIQKFKNLFRAIIITEALGELTISVHLCPKKYIGRTKRAAKKAIKAALKSFEALISL